LPADGDTLCTGLDEVPQCREATQSMLATYEAELQKEPDSYDERAATGLYERAKKSEASCYEPEYSCIFDKLAEYGATKQSHKWLDKNVAMLGQRQTLLHKVSTEVGEQCLTEGATKHQARVIDTYKKYVRRPILFFRVQLHMAFLAVHNSQVSCLTSKAK
jgi:hypothetical protein